MKNNITRVYHSEPVFIYVGMPLFAYLAIFAYLETFAQNSGELFRYWISDYQFIAIFLLLPYLITIIVGTLCMRSHVKLGAEEITIRISKKSKKIAYTAIEDVEVTNCNCCRGVYNIKIRLRNDSNDSGTTSTYTICAMNSMFCKDFFDHIT